MNQEFVDVSGPGITRGWYWRFVGATVVILAILELLAFSLSKGKYTFISSGELGMFLTGILVVQRAKVRRTGNTLVAVIASYVINIIFQLTVGMSQTAHYGWANFIEQNAIIAAIGILFAIVYSRTTAWSDKRRQQNLALRAEKKVEASPEDRPPLRVHRVKKKRGRGKRN